MSIQAQKYDKALVDQKQRTKLKRMLSQQPGSLKHLLASIDYEFFSTLSRKDKLLEAVNSKY